MAEEMTHGPNPRMRKVWFYLIAVVLAGTLFLTLWIAGYGLSPQKRYHEEFAHRFALYLNQVEVRSTDAENKIKNDPEYQKLNATYKQLLEQEEAQAKELRAKLDEANKQLAPVRTIFLNLRDPEHMHESYQEVEEKYNHLKQQSDDLTRQLNALMQPSRDALEAANAFISAKMTDLTPEQLDKLKKKYVDGKSTLDGTQISLPDINRVDQCQTCHIGMSVTGLELTPASMSLPSQKPDTYARAFVTHPKPELLRIHNPAKFGCTLCHGGNGREATSVELAHGNVPNSPSPLYPKVYMEAGCQTCHRADMVLAGRTELAEILDRSKDIYRQGCMGCHRYPGFNDEQVELKSVAGQMRALEQQKENNLRQATLKQAKADVSLREDDAQRLRQEVRTLSSEDSQIDLQVEQLEEQTRDLMREEKKVGHNLKEIRQKAYPGWIPFLIMGPGRPLGPTMATDDQIRSMAAYLWQTAIQDPIAKQERGDPVRGKDLLETRGCLGCHPIAMNPVLPVHTVPPTISLMGEGPVMGGGFAIPLSRVGERDRYDYLVRWINNPRQRLRPYCPREKKDIGPEDYARHGLPFRFDRDHDRCPNDGAIMNVQQKMVMPNLRLTLEESRDIASYLTSLKARDPESFPALLDDPKLQAEGKALIEHYGCSGCHEIGGFETQDPIGPELTYEGSKPVEQLNFGHLRHMAQSGGGEPMIEHEDRERLPEGPAKGPWYSLKGFLEHKVAEPNVFDRSTTSLMERARMPNARLTTGQLRAVTTLLLGSQKTGLPESYIYKPDDARGDIQRGWWVIRKYNCMGCHQILPGQQTSLMTVPRYREHPEQLPPTLVMEGARVNPEWLAKFLKDPALGDSDTHRNSVRPYLQVRMPTFSFSDNEIRILVRFFQAMSHQPMISTPDPVEALTAKENEAARTLMSSACVKCHATGDPARDKLATAPNFLLTRGRLNPRWIERWIVDPQTIIPGTAMPNGLFRKENGHWVLNGPKPPALKGYDQDQANLLVRYVFQLTPQEQRRLLGKGQSRSRQRQNVQVRMPARQAGE